MKKFLKICAIVGVSVLLAGLAVGGVAYGLGGRLDGRVAGGVCHGIASGISGGIAREIYNEIYDEDRDDFYEEDWDDGFERGNGNRGSGNRGNGNGRESLNRQQETFQEEIRALDLEISLGDVRLISEEDREFISVCGEEFHAFVKDGTLMIEPKETMTSAVMDNWRPDVTVIIPRGYEFEKAEISVDAGEAWIEELTAKELEVSAGMGIVEIQHAKAGYVELDCDMGELDYSGIVEHSLEADCGMGNLSLELEGQKEDFTYHLEGSMDSIIIEEETFSGISEKGLDMGNGKKLMELECDMGTITVSFGG